MRIKKLNEVSNYEESQTMTQREFYNKMLLMSIQMKDKTLIEIEQQYVDVFDKAPVGASVSVDNRILGGFYNQSSGAAYDFKKTSDSTWKEIFGDYKNVTSKELANMIIHSKGFQRRMR